MMKHDNVNQGNEKRAIGSPKKLGDTTLFTPVQPAPTVISHKSVKKTIVGAMIVGAVIVGAMIVEAVIVGAMIVGAVIVGRSNVCRSNDCRSNDRRSNEAVPFFIMFT